MLSWSLIQWGLTRSNGVSQDSVSARTALFLLSHSNGRGTQSVRARVQARGSIKDLAHHPSSADVFTVLRLGPLSPPFYYFLSTRVTMLDFPSFVVKLTQGTFNDVCCDHIHWTCWLFCSCFLFGLGLDSSPVLSDCSKRTYTLRQTDFSLFIRIFCCIRCFVRFTINPFPYKLNWI